MKKTIALICAVIAFFSLTAYEWGTSSKKTEDKTAAATTMMGENAKAIATASAVLGSGTAEERQQRLDTLKKVSRAMAKNKAPAATTQKPAATPQTETRRGWGF